MCKFNPVNKDLLSFLDVSNAFHDNI